MAGEGVVYRLSREDLRISYVGKTKNLAYRTKQHRRGRGKTRILWHGDIEPKIETLAMCETAAELDMAEMEAIETEIDRENDSSWKCLNTIRSPQTWDSAESRHRAAVNGGRSLLGSKRPDGHKFYSDETRQAHRDGVRRAGKSLPREHFVRMSKIGNANIPLEARQRNGRVVGKKYGRLNIMKYNSISTPEQRRRPMNSASMHEVNSRRRFCLDCPMVCNPGSMGRHLKASGHSGWSNVATDEDET